MKQTKTGENVEDYRPGTGKGERSQDSLTRTVTFQQRLEGSERRCLENVWVMSLPKNAIRTKLPSWAHSGCVEEQ